MDWIKSPWVRNVGIPTAIFATLLAGPWFLVFSLTAFPLALLALGLVPPIWWRLVRGRTDEVGRGVMAGMLIGPLFHLAAFVGLIFFIRGPGRGDGGLGNLYYVFPLGGLVVLGVFWFMIGGLVGGGIIFLQRLVPTTEQPKPRESV